MGLFDRKFVPIPEMTAGSLFPPPHLSWEKDYGVKRVPDLKAGTQALLSTYLAKKGEPLVPDPMLQSYYQDFIGIQADTLLMAKNNSSKFSQTTVVLVALKEIFDRVAEWPDHNPFDGFSVDELTTAPEYLQGRKEALGWAFVQGHVLATAERVLSYAQPPGKIDRRTWAAVGGLAFIYAVDAFPIDYSAEVDYDNFEKDEEFGTRTKSLLAFLSHERSLVRGYLDARGIPRS